MPSQTPQQSGARLTSRVVNIPESGMSRIVLTPGQHLEFSFDPARATFSRSGTDLVIADANGAGVTLSGFFVAENADSLPQFILPGGENVPASAYLQSLNIDITTAAGPTPTATPPSSGEGEYADGAGDLLGGVDRLGSLGSNQWSRSTSAAEIIGSDRLLAAGRPAEVGPDFPPAAAPIFNARAVLYMQNEGDAAPNGQPYDTRSVTVQALAKGADGQWDASGQDAISIKPHEGNELDADWLIERVVDGKGNITFRLTPAGKAWMDANGKDMVAYYTITDANGSTYVLQVVISADGKFDSSSEHNGNLDPNGLAHGEWHDGKDILKETDYKTTSSNLSDDLRYTSKVTGAEINTGYAADKNWGNDSASIKGEVHRSSLTSGAGDDVISITGGGSYDRSFGGEWPAGMSAAAGPRSREEAGGAAVWGGNIDAGDGNNTIRISGGAMYGIMETTLTTGSGDDLIEISGGGTHDRMDVNGRDRYFGGNAVKDSVIAAGDGNNTITITSDYPFNPNVTGNDTIGGYSMAAVNNSKIITGSGDDSITINAAAVKVSSGETVYDNAMYASTIAAGAGGDIVMINGNINWGGVIALGNTTDRADTDQCQRNDVNTLNLNSNEVWKSAIYGTAGTDIINAVGVQFSQMTVATGAGSDSVHIGELNDSTIALGNTIDRADTDHGGRADVNTLKTGHVLRSFIYGSTGRDEITAGGVVASTIATGAGSDKVGVLHLDGSTIALGNTTDKAGTDADQKNDVNTLVVGGPGTEFVGAIVEDGMVYGTAGTDLLNLHGGVTGSTVDTGTGAGDKVDIRGSVFSTSATDNNTVKAVDGAVLVTMKGANAQAVSAAGAGARNTISGNSVDITAEGTTTAYGLYAKGAGASNEIGGGDLTVTATGDLTIIAEGGSAPGTGNFSPLGLGGIGIVGEGTRDTLARNEPTSLEGNLKISGSNYGVYNQNADNVLKALRGNVEISGGSYGVVWRESHWGTPPAGETELSISAGTDVILKGQRGLVLTDAGRAGWGQVQDSQNSAATVHADRNLTLTGDGGANGGIGIEYLQSGVGKSLELSAGQNLSIDATGNGVARGVYSLSNSGDKASISMDAGHNLSISAHTKGGDAGYFRDFQMSQSVSSQEGAVGVMLLSGATTTNTFKAGNNLTISAKDESDTASYAVLNAATKAIFEAGGTATFMAEGGKERYGLFTTGGSTSGWADQGPFNGLTKVAAKMVNISASGTEKAYGTHTRGVDNTDYSSSAGRQYGSADTEIHAAGTANIAAQSAGSAYALYTQSGKASDNPTHQGASASTTVTGKDVFLAATGGEQAFGIYTEAGKAEASTAIAAKESVTVTASGENAWGVIAKGGEASNTMKSGARLNVTAKTTGPGREDNASARAEAGAFGLYAADGGKVTAETKGMHITATAKGEQWAVGARAEDGGHVELTARDIEVKAKVEAVDKTIDPRVHAFALETHNGDITVNMTGHSRNTLLLEAENRLQTGKANGDNFAAGIFAEGKSNVLIKGDKNATNQITIKTVTGEGGSVGVYTFGKDSDVSILGGDHFDDITIDAASNTGGAVGIRVSANTSDVLVDTGKGGDLATIRAHSSEQSDKTHSHAYGLQNMGGTITVKAVEGSVDIGTFSNKSNSYAMSAAGPTAVNSVESRRAHLKADSNEGVARGMHAQQCATNHVSGWESVTVEAKGGTAHGLYAETGASNHVTGKTVGITATGTNSATGVYATGSGSSNAVSASGAVNITASGGDATSGVNAQWGGVNSITAKGDVDISASGGRSNYGMSATGGASAPNPPATNHIHDVTGKVSITAEGGKNACGMSASVSGVNRIENTGRVEITAEGTETSYAMHATSCGTNTIINNNGDALIVVIKATGGSLGNYAMYAEIESRNEIIGGDGNDVISLKGDIYTDAAGKNIINVGAGDDQITLDGKVSGNFHLDAGDGYDILVLRASSWAEFTVRYQAWLTANFDTMNIESIQWALNNPSGAVPGWLQDLVNNYNNLHSDAPIDLSPATLTDLAHIVAGDMNNIINHDGDVTAVHTTQHAGDGHGLAAFGDGDDYVHVRGNVDHVDFTLSDGHNILHVDGNALSDISDGHNGNDIRVGGSFGGVIDLGSGDDHVELGALHDGGILLGVGNDHLALSAFTGGTLDGGAGHDILTLNLDGHGGAEAFATGGAFSGLFTPGAVQNFEELHFDLSGGAGDSLAVEDLIDSLRGLTLGGQTSVRITGDAGSDHVDTQALSNNGWTSSTDPTTGSRWTHADSEDENLIILIQNGLR